jgi:hypothetical protein
MKAVAVRGAPKPRGNAEPEPNTLLLSPSVAQVETSTVMFQHPVITNEKLKSRTFAGIRRKCRDAANPQHDCHPLQCCRWPNFCLISLNCC